MFSHINSKNRKKNRNKFFFVWSLLMIKLICCKMVFYTLLPWQSKIIKPQSHQTSSDLRLSLIKVHNNVTGVNCALILSVNIVNILFTPPRNRGYIFPAVCLCVSMCLCVCLSGNKFMPNGCTFGRGFH